MDHSDQPTSQTRIVGWGFVMAQFILLALLLASGSAQDWPVPGWLHAMSWVLFVLGMITMAAAAFRLGWSLTPTPLPRRVGQLKTDGLYRFARHPIYSGLLAVVVAIAIRSASFVTAGIAVAIVIFFNVKAAWEERRLSAHYDGYDEYAARTPRFVPSLR